MPHRVRKRRLLAPKYLLGQQVALERLAQEIFALAVHIHLHRGVYAHDIPHEVKIPERHPRFHPVHRDAPVRAQDIVHIKLPHPLRRFGRERRGRGRVVGVLVAEKLVGHLAGQQHFDIRVLADILAHEIHPHARADGGYVECPERRHHIFERGQHIAAVYDDLCVIRADIPRHLRRVFEVDGVGVHAYGECPYPTAEQTRRHRADYAAVQPARKQKSHRRVGVQPLLYAPRQLFAYVPRHCLEVVRVNGTGICGIGVAHELSVRVVAPRRKGAHLVRYLREVLRLGGEHDMPALRPAVKEGADAYGIARRDERVPLRVVDDRRELRVQPLEHPDAVLFVQRE